MANVRHLRQTFDFLFKNYINYGKSMARCPKCGKDNPDKQRLCFGCGFDLKEPGGVKFEPRKSEGPTWQEPKPAVSKQSALKVQTAAESQPLGYLEEPRPEKPHPKRWFAVGFLVGAWVIASVFWFLGYLPSLQNQFTKTMSPPYIQIENRNVNLVFNASDGALHQWIIGVDVLEAQIEAGYLRRELIPNLLLPAMENLYENVYLPLAVLAGSSQAEIQEVYSTIENLAAYGVQYITLTDNETGENHLVMDFRPFVVENNFAVVTTDLYHELGRDDEALVYEIWYIVTQLTAYSSEIEETPRYPLETLLGGGGDCEDMAILIASMLKGAPANYTVKFVYMDANNPTNPQEINHALLWVETPSGYKTFVDGTSKGAMSPFTLVDGWYLEV